MQDSKFECTCQEAERGRVEYCMKHGRFSIPVVSDEARKKIMVFEDGRQGVPAEDMRFVVGFLTTRGKVINCGSPGMAWQMAHKEFLGELYEAAGLNDYVDIWHDQYLKVVGTIRLRTELCGKFNVEIFRTPTAEQMAAFREMRIDGETRINYDMTDFGGPNGGDRSSSEESGVTKVKFLGAIRKVYGVNL